MKYYKNIPEYSAYWMGYGDAQLKEKPLNPWKDNKERETLYIAYNEGYYDFKEYRKKIRQEKS